MSKRNSEPDERLRNNIKQLGFSLGEVLIEQEGKDLYDKVEKLRALTKELRRGNSDSATIKIRLLVKKFSPERILQCYKSFFNLFYSCKCRR